MTPAARSRRTLLGFYLGFGLVALVIAGALSYLADSDPDGLDSVTLDGCREVRGELHGSCIAQRADDHALADGPLADYTVGGNGAMTGMAGVLGVLVTLGVAGGLFWLARRRNRPSDGQGVGGSAAPDGDSASAGPSSGTG